LSGSNLIGTNLTGAKLAGAKLTGANLTGAKGLPKAPIIPDIDIIASNDVALASIIKDAKAEAKDNTP
jgi:uncharacterized protein YjbI with pentapeptide repeats